MLSQADLDEIAARYHRDDWTGFDQQQAVLDIGRLLGHISVLNDRLVAVEELALFATHADDCDSHGNEMVDGGPCTCGYTAAWFVARA